MTKFKKLCHDNYVRLQLYGNSRRKEMIYRALILTLQNVGLVYAEGLS